MQFNLVHYRLRFLGLLFVILLTSSNIKLLMKAIQDIHKTKGASVNEDRFRIGRFDQNRHNIIFDSLFVGDSFLRLFQEKHLCLATISTLDKLHWLPQLATHWGGLVSLAIYLKDSEEQLFKYYLNYLYICHSEVMANVTIHLIRPASMAGKNSRVSSNLGLGPPLIQCSNSPTVIKTFTNYRAATNIPQNPGIPQNHLRNVARKGCGTSYVLTIDIDVIPSKYAEGLFEKFLKKKETENCTKCAFVIPTFEIDVNVDFPRSKSELLAFESKGLARPFHEEVFIGNQFATNISRWRSFNTTDDIVVSHSIGDFKFSYEPFYVSLDTAPPHDERFVGYGYTRNTQVYEMLVSGWKFHVLSPVFFIHWGLQRRDTRPEWREYEIYNNKILFDTFKRELKARYNLQDL